MSLDTQCRRGRHFKVFQPDGTRYLWLAGCSAERGCLPLAWWRARVGWRKVQRRP